MPLTLNDRIQSLKSKSAKTYKDDIISYARDKFGVEFWDSAIADSQKGIVLAVANSLLKQEEKLQVDNGTLDISECKHYVEGEIIKDVIDVQSGHGTGKSFAFAIVFLWVFDVWEDSAVYTFSPTKDQAETITWRYLRTLHTQGAIKGKQLVLKIKNKENPNNFIINKVAPQGKQATTTVHGFHGTVFVGGVDESQHFDKTLFDALDAVTSGGIHVLMLASNPKKGFAPARRYRTLPNCAAFTLSLLNFPNVYYGKEYVKNATGRAYVLKLLPKCQKTDKHDKKLNTFQIHWLDDGNQIYIPSDEFSWRVLGVPSSRENGDTFFTEQMLETAVSLPIRLNDPFHIARIGVDMARFGDDKGTIYVRHAGSVSLYAVISYGDTEAYQTTLRTLFMELATKGITDIGVRVDSTGGYGIPVEDYIRNNPQWKRMFDYISVSSVNFRNIAGNSALYADIVTEMYAETAKVIERGLRIRGHYAQTLTQELTGRTYSYTPISSAISRKFPSLKSQHVRRISKKTQFKSKYHFSPDHADGLCLAAAPDSVFVRYIYRKTKRAPSVTLY